MTAVAKISYWNHNAVYNDLLVTLHQIIDEKCGPEGEVKGSKNKALERLRKAKNAYYDLYNNGLWNRARSFSRVFGIAAGSFMIDPKVGRYSSYLYTLTNEKMDEIVLAAAVEQGIFCPIK